MRKSRLNKKGKSPLAKAKDRLWKTLKKVIDIRDADICVSCGTRGLVGANKHGGHFIPSSSCGGFLRYDIRNVFNQCASCNLFRNGAGAEYTLALQKKFGLEFVEQIIRDKQKSIKLDVDYVEGMTEFYESLLTKPQKQLLKITKEYKGYTND
jgi:hypothetical protein